MGTQPPPTRKHGTHTTATPHTRAKKRKNEKNEIKTSGTQPPLENIPQKIKGASISGGQNDEDKGANGQYEVGARPKHKRLEILKSC